MVAFLVEKGLFEVKLHSIDVVGRNRRNIRLKKISEGGQVVIDYINGMARVHVWLEIARVIGTGMAFAAISWHCSSHSTSRKIKNHMPSENLPTSFKAATLPLPLFSNK
jgi:hypothetical protein